MTSPDPDPRHTTGLTAGGAVVGTDTPPAESSTSASARPSPDAPNQGPVAGNRTPAVVTLVALALIVVCMLGYGVAEIAGYFRR